MKLLKITLLGLWGLCACNSITHAAQTDRIRFNDKDIFLNGLNLAWQSFADDIGPNPNTPRLNHFRLVFSQVHANGGNAVRLWLHTNGSKTPDWDGHFVTGPGTDTIEDLRNILDLAWEYECGLILCLWSFDMLRASFGSNVTDRAMAILTQDENRQSYIENSLIPMVSELAGHPAIIAWEIFNEPEGMSNEHGWGFTRHVPMSSIQAFINQCAGAIHRTDPDVLVSNGSWAFIAASDIGSGNTNYYTDERLIAAGGDPDGTLDFYMVHYYDWAGEERSPFHKRVEHWQLDKPLVVAEFYADGGCSNCGTYPYETLHKNGYGGALGWSWTDISPDDLLYQIADATSKFPQDVLLSDKGRPIVRLNTPANKTWYAEDSPIDLSAEASDPNGSVKEVHFYISGTLASRVKGPPFSTGLNSWPSGEHVIRAAAIDEEGYRTFGEARSIIIGRPDLTGGVALGRFEAEDAAFSGLAEASSNDASGGAYLTMQGSGSITWTIEDVPITGPYNMIIGYNLIYDSPKTNIFSVNRSGDMSVTFSGTVDEWAEMTVPVDLQKGTNTIRVTPSWGWMIFDYIDFRGNEDATSFAIEVNAVLDSGNAWLSYYAPPGVSYDLWFSEDLINWSPVQSDLPQSTPSSMSHQPNEDLSARYYRILPTP
jgi:hypothetical protein